MPTWYLLSSVPPASLGITILDEVPPTSLGIIFNLTLIVMDIMAKLCPTDIKVVDVPLSYYF